MLAFTSVLVSWLDVGGVGVTGKPAAGTVVASALLAASLVVVLSRRKWYGLEPLAIVVTYAVHWVWLDRMFDWIGAHKPFPEFAASAALLTVYWAIFAISHFLRGEEEPRQRYLLTALRTAHDAGYTGMAAHVLANLSVQATTLNQPGDAVVLGEAAARAGANSPASVRASIASRLGHAYAGANRIREFQRVSGQGFDLLDQRNVHQDPEWMYYLTPNHLECQAGYSLILAGRRQPFPKIAGDIQHPFGIAVTDQAILRVIDRRQGSQ